MLFWRVARRRLDVSGFSGCVFVKGWTEMLRTVTFRFLALVLAIGITTSGFAQTGQWVDVGSARVNGSVDHDTIQARDKGTFRALQIRVRGSSVPDHCALWQWPGGTD